jgi:hypothetical protein
MPFAIRADRLVRGPDAKMIEVTVCSRRAESLRLNDYAARRGFVRFAHTSTHVASAMVRAA